MNRKAGDLSIVSAIVAGALWLALIYYFFQCALLGRIDVQLFWIAFFCDVHYIPFLRQGFSLILLSNPMVAAIFTGASFRSGSGPLKSRFLRRFMFGRNPW